MELNEFKLLWNNNLSVDKKVAVQGKELDFFLDSSLEKVNQLARASKLWLKISTVGIGLVVILFLITASLYLWYPRELGSLINALPVLLLLPVFVWVVGLLYYKQAIIFDIYKYNNLSTALRQIIGRFKNWYRWSVVLFAILLFPVFYFLLTGVAHKLNVTILPILHVGLCCFLTILTLLLNHLHYKGTYFKWLNKLENNLNDLAIPVN